MVLRIFGMAAAIALLIAAWFAYDNYDQFANVARWTGDKDLRWLRPWLTELRMPLLAVTIFLGLTLLSWVWRKLKLGH